MTRRAVRSACHCAVLVVALTVVAACGGSGAPTAEPATPPATSPTPSQSPSTSPGPTTTPTPTAEPVAPVLAPVTSWQPGAGEVEPQVKVLATRLVETAGSWAGAGDVESLRARLVAAGFAPELADPLAPLLDGGASAAQVGIAYPQYGGLRGGRASIMIPLSQSLVRDGHITDRGHAVDVRLVQGPGGWAVESAAVAVPPPPTGALSPVAAAVLVNPRIGLPESARADIVGGLVEDVVLEAMTRLAQAHSYDVAVLVGGHPPNVFGTDRVSNHTVGRGVDIWRFDGMAVVDPATPATLVESAMRAAAAAGGSEVGGPVDLDGPGGTFFSDLVHQDHVHVGISG